MQFFLHFFLVRAALGFEKMLRGPLITKYNDRSTPMQRHADLFNEMFEIEAVPITAQVIASSC